MDNKYVIYDLEVLANFFSGVFKDITTGKKKTFIIHHSINQLHEFVRFLNQLIHHNYWLVGFNCNDYDAQILHFILKNYKKYTHWSANKITEELARESNRVTSFTKFTKFGNLVPAWQLPLKQIDLFKQKHYDGTGKSCSLKWLEFTMRFPNIESMPIHHTEKVSEEQVLSILEYNDNDVDATEESFKINAYESDLRFKLSEEYSLNLINASEPKMARDIFGKFMSEAMGIPYKELRELKTPRFEICVKDILFDYITFHDKELQDTKKFFEELTFDPEKVENNNLKFDLFDIEGEWVENDKEIKKIERRFSYHNLKEVVVGLGGLHGCINPGVYSRSASWVIHDIDGTSYYPNLGIKNRVYPEHLSEVFCDVTEMIFDLRQTYDKKDPRNTGLKLVINSTYGLTKEKNGYLYDPKYTYTITINGQLLLLKLGELLKSKVKSIIFYQFNTDGVTIGYDPAESEKVKECMALWSKKTKIALEDKFYDKMIIVDVNNYLAIDTKGNVKRKGLFGYSMKPEDKEMDYHKNPSMLVVPKALEAYFVHGIPVEKTIRENKDIYDFCLGVKITKDFDLIHYYRDTFSGKIVGEKIKQSVVRYYVSKDNTSLKKRYNAQSKTPNKLIEIIKKKNTTYFNTFVKKSMKDYNLDYGFYISQANKIIDKIFLKELF